MRRLSLSRLSFPLTAFVTLLLGSASASAQSLVISEFRNRGPNGANDEFVEIYNDSDKPHTVAATDGSKGYAVAASDGLARFVIPNGTVIPARGHFLGVNTAGYSLASYPAGNGMTATGDATFTTNIADNAGIALFKTSDAASFSLATRLDAVGATSEANTLYREGAGYPALTPFSIDYSFYRRVAETGPSTPSACLSALGGVAPRDTNDNASDFTFVDTNGTSAGAGQRLGAPSPQNLSSPVQSLVATATAFTRLAPGAGVADPPNLVRDPTSLPAQNSTFGTVAIRRRFTNDSGAPITRLRFRVIGISTFPAPSGVADLRTRTSSNVLVTLPEGGGQRMVKGTTIEQPPMQPNGGAFNGTFSVNDVTKAAPLGVGESIDLQFLFGIQQAGKLQVFLEVEALPTVGRTVWGVIGDTEGATPTTDCALQASTTAISSSAQKVPVGAAVTLTASVTAPSAAAGSVTFMDGATELAIVPLAAGKAQLTTSTLAAGPHTITALYAGDGLLAPSTSTQTLVEVGNLPDATNASPSTSPSPPGAPEGLNEAAPNEADEGGGCTVGGRADIGSWSFLGLLLAVALVAGRRSRV